MRRTLATAAATGLTALALLTGPGIATAAPGQPTSKDTGSRVLSLGLSLSLSFAADVASTADEDSWHG